MKLRVIGGIVALVLSASTVAAQQPQTMDSLNHRLDSLVARMNRTSGNQKMQAMAAVINELVGQRKAMQAGMHQMMEGGGAMEMMSEPTSPGPQPAARADSVAADTTNHADHHPPQ